VGTIPMDGSFRRLPKVNFNVTNARVGRITDYDRLVYGNVDQRRDCSGEALGIAAKSSRTQFDGYLYRLRIRKSIIRAGSEETNCGQSRCGPSSTPTSTGRLNELELSVRSANCLRAAEIRMNRRPVQKTEIRIA